MFSHIRPLCLLLTCLASALHAAAPFDPLVWKADASEGARHAHKAIDRDPGTRWDTGGSQAVGQWFQIDMRDTRLINRIEIDTAQSASDYARKYDLAVSLDGRQWKTAATGSGAVLTEISLPANTSARYLRLSIAGGSRVSSGFWSIHEFRVFGPEDPGAIPHPPIRWRTIEPKFPTRDIVVAAYDIRDFGIDPAANEDATLAIQTAAALLARAGGGTLWLPAGHYRLSEPITLDHNVCIRGDWQKPEPGKPVLGTILELAANRGDADAPPGITVTNAAAVKNVTIWYPEQDPANIVPYPVALKQIGGNGMAVENVTFVNAYRGFACGPEGCALFFLRNVYGTVLETGVAIDSTADIGRMEMIRLSPQYWAGSGLPGSPAANGPHVAWMRDYGTGLVFRRNDWSFTYDVEIDGYHTGLRTLPSLGHEDVSQNRKSYPNGNHARLKFLNCRIGAHLEDVASVGFMIHDSEITGAEIGVLADDTFSHTLQFTNCRITDTHVALRMLGTGQMLVTNSDLEGGIENKNGYVSFAGGKSRAVAEPGGPDGAGTIAILPDPGIPPIKTTYKTPADRTAPPTSALAVVTDSGFGAKADAKTDDTGAVELAIKSMAAKGGGTVFFPAGEYRITRPLTIPSGVELRGVCESPHHAQTRGSVIDVIPGRGQKDGTPFITLSGKSGLRGLTFHYPELDATDIRPYPWMIRGNGADIRVINVSCTMAYQMLDFATHRCDRHYIDYVAGHGLLEAFRIGGGSRGGRILNCQLNANYYAFTNSYANSPNKMSPGDHGKYMKPVYAYAKENGRAFVFEDCVDQTIFQNFVFGAREGVVLTGTQGGPSGWCHGQGSDQCAKGLLIDRIGAAGLPIVNCQMVTVPDNGEQRAYVETSPDFTGTAHVLGLDAWGVPSSAIRVRGGALNLVSSVITNGGESMLRLEPDSAATLNGTVFRGGGTLIDLPSNTRGLPILHGLVVTEHGKATVFPTYAAIPENRIAMRVPGTSVGAEFNPARALPTNDWKVAASVNPGAASNALDHDPGTRWATGRPAAPGDEFGVDLGSMQTLSKIRINTTGSSNDYPRMMQIMVSEDGGDWSDVVYSGKGGPDLRLAFTPRKARYILIRNLSEMGGFWSIHELQVGQSQAPTTLRTKRSLDP